MKYLRIFEKESDYTQYIVGDDDYVTPHVALVRDTNVVKYQIYEPDYTADKYLCIEALTSDTHVDFAADTGGQVWYSLDGYNWTEVVYRHEEHWDELEDEEGNIYEEYWEEYVKENEFPILSAGQKLYIKGTLGCDSGSISSYAVGYFYIDQPVNLSGNCNSIVFGDDADTNFDLSVINFGGRLYSGMFRGNPIINISRDFLPATTLTYECYSSMFESCASLVTAPELPATTLIELCYAGMFMGCTSLVTAPSILPATELAPCCYYDMFYGCTSLVTAPELPATTLADYCYYEMFSGCESLVTAPELPATELTLDCYSGMFYGCSELNYIKALFTTDPDSGSYTSYWVEEVSPTGTFVKNADATWDVTGPNGIPEGWTVETATA